MYTILLTLVSVAYSYPYARAYNEPILRAEYPYYAMNMYNQQQQQGGGMPGMMGLLNQYLPGFFDSPSSIARTMSMFGLQQSDFNDLFEGARKGDYEKIYGKVFDGNSDFPLPMMGGMMNSFMGGMGAPSTGASTTSTNSVNPYLWGLIDLQRAHSPVRPVNNRLMATRQMPGMGMGGMGMGYPNMQEFMGAMNKVFTNPHAMMAMQSILDGSDMADIQEALIEGDVYKLYRKTMGKGFNPMAFTGAASTGTTGTTSSTTSSSSFGGYNPYFWNFWDYYN